MKPIERLALYLRQHKIRYSTAEKEAGIANGYLGKQVRSNASIGSDILEKICTAYPKLNPAWLLTGNGNEELDAAAKDKTIHPLQTESSAGTKQEELYKLQIEGLLAQVNHLKQEIKLQDEIIQMLRSKRME
jgi:hypothetical protein